MPDNIDFQKITNHWIETSEKDFKTMEHLFLSEDYHWALFMGHIVLERLLKACVVKETKDHAPFTHDLTRLASLSKIYLSPEYSDWMDTITTFNLNARYDSYKQAFYLKCTPDFTTAWIDKIKRIRLWIKETQLK